MYRACSRMRPLARRALAVAGVAAAAGIASGAAVAATSKPPTLKIGVPATVKPGQKFKIYLYVTYDKKTTHTKPYIVSFVQFSKGACRATAQREHALPNRDWKTDYVGPVTNSPFKEWYTWTSGTLRGTRHVCAYLYAKSVRPTAHVHPILTASAKYKNV
jgi:hypothetical protein